MKKKLCTFGVVIVTFNRCKKLEKTLYMFDKQTYLPQYIVVVNNASTDDTKNYLANWEKEITIYSKYVINNIANLGGSGGFYIGLKEAIQLQADWIWVSDDDAYPEERSLSIAADFLKQNSDLVAICGAVYVDNNIDLSHRRNIRKKGLRLIDEPVTLNKYVKPFEINEFSYVGSIISKKSLQKVGLTNKDYFIHYDDTEHSLRLSKIGKIICVPQIKVSHDIESVQDVGTKEYNSSWQKYYDYRNLLEMYRSVFPYRYYLFQYSVYRLKAIFAPFFGITKMERKILIAALNDVKQHKQGIHLLYRPGYKA